MTDLTKQQVDDLLTSLRQLVGSGSRAFSGPSERSAPFRRNRSDEGGRDNTKDLNLSFKALKAGAEDFKKTSEHYAKQSHRKGLATKKSEGIARQYDSALLKQTAAINLYSDELNSYRYKNLGQQITAANKLTERSSNFASQLAKSQLSASLLSASLVSSRETFTEGTNEYNLFIEKLSKSVDGLDKAFLSQSGLWDEMADGIRDNLSPEDFKQLRLKMGSAQTAISETFAGLEQFGIKDLESLKAAAANPADTQTANAIDKSVKLMVKKLVAQGYGGSLNIKGTGGNGEITDDDIENFAEALGTSIPALQKFETALTGTVKKLDKNVGQAVTALGRKQIQIESAIKNWKEPIQNGVAGAWGLNKLKDSAKQAAKEIAEFNTLQIPASFTNVQMSAIRMGMSFEDQIKFLKENARTVAMYGKAGFDGLQKEVSGTFATFGYTAKQSADLIGPAFEAAAESMNVDMKNREALNSYITDSMNGFREVASATGITADAYFKLNSELYKSEGVSTLLLGLDKKQAMMYKSSLEAQRNELVLRGLSNEQAQEVIKAQEAAKKAKIADRFTESGNILMRAQAVGMSPEDAIKAMKIKQNSRSASKKEQEWFTNTFTPEFKKKEAQFQTEYDFSNNTSASLSRESLLEATELSSDTRKLMDSGLASVGADKSNMGIDAKRNAENMEAAKASQMVRGTADAFNTASALFNNSLSGIVMGTGASVAGLGLSALMAAKALGGVTAAAGGKGVTDMLGGFGGKGGKILGIGSKLLGGLGLGIAAVDAGMDIYESESDRNSGKISAKEANKKTGGAVGGLAGMWAGAAMGAGVGGVAGLGVGAIPGALVGGTIGYFGGSAAGGGIGGMFGSDSTSPINAPDALTQSAAINTSTNVAQQSDSKSSTSIINVADSESIRHLSAISENTALSARILQQLIGTSQQKNVSFKTEFSNDIPSSNEYLYNKPVTA